MDNLHRNSGPGTFLNADLWIAAALFTGNLFILGPWLTMEFSNQPWNNGYIYVGIARMFRDLSWTWDPLQYAGAPFHYLYPPIFHLLVGAIPFVPLGLAFHIVSGVGYALVPVCLYILARQLFPSQMAAVFAAVAYSAFPSPAYVLPQLRALAHPFAHAPWGFVALAGYDEAPHAFGLSFMLLAIAAAWTKRWTLASLLAGLVFLINWPALIGLAFPLAGVCVAGARESRAVHSLSSVAGVFGIGYGISAFWMTPAYFVSSTLLNRVVLRHTVLAQPWNGASWTILAVALLLVGFSFWRRTPPELALILVWAALSGLVVVSYIVAGNYLLPLPHRYMLEFNTALVLLTAWFLSYARGRTRVILASVLISSGIIFSFRFLTHSWKFEPQAADARGGIAYRIASWLRDNSGGRRVLVSGELDSTLNLWTDVPQVGGTQQDIVNFLIYAAQRQVVFGCGAGAGHIAELWLRALNAPLIVVHGASSREFYHWYAQPDRFASLPVAWDDGAGDIVYRIPDFAAHEAVVVDLAGLAKLPRLDSTSNALFLDAYVNWAAGKRPVELHRISAADVAFDTNLQAGEAVLLKVNYDRGWRATGATLGSDPIGFQLIHAPPGQRHIALRFGPSWDTWLGRAITLVTAFLLLARVKPLWIACAAVIPAGAAWAMLVSAAPPTARVAEEAFDRLQPPLINAQGIVDSLNAQQPPLQRGRLVTIYGLNFGAPGDNVRVWVGNRPARYEFQSANLITLRWPMDVAASAAVSVEVNGCSGNAFTVATR
jgi:hypothetical protein